MFRPLLLTPAMLLAGCISFSSTESPSTPDSAGFCREKEMQCKDICGSTGVLLFSCKAAPSLEYQCQCKKPEQRL
jgi:hypothetical protein